MVSPFGLSEPVIAVAPVWLEQSCVDVLGFDGVGLCSNGLNEAADGEVCGMSQDAPG